MRRLSLFLLIGMGMLIGMPLALYADEGTDNIGRTEEDDEYEDVELSQQLGKLGAVQVPIEIAEDCQATIGLYTPQGQLVRILGQVLNLKKGSYTARWDGLDLFGNIVPPTQELVVKTITNKPIRAFYEFSVSSPKVAPWPYGTGEGKDRRQGGWLGDHSAPGSAAAIGDRVFIGCTLAEFGNNLISVTLDGEVCYGTKLAGWSGPSLLTTDGQLLYAVDRNRNTVYRLNPDFSQNRRKSYGKIFSQRDRIQTFAVADGKIYIVSQNKAASTSAFSVALGNGQIDFANSRPQVLDTSAPTEFTISPQAAFGNTFTTPANPQNGAGFIMRGGKNGFVVAVFKEPVQIGTVALSAVAGADVTEVYILRDGLRYEDQKHSPVRGGEDDDFRELDDNWILLGKVDARSPVAFVTSPKGPAKTGAMYVRTSAKNPRGGWRPRISMARIMTQRFERVPATITRSIIGEVEKDTSSDFGQSGYKLQMRYPVSSIYPADTVMDLGEMKEFDGICLMNCVNPFVEVFTLKADYTGDPAKAGDDAWALAGTYKSAFNKKIGHASASRSGNEAYVTLYDRTKSRAVRLRVNAGYPRSKWGHGGENAFLVECQDVALVKRLDYVPRPPSHVLRIVGAQDGKQQAEMRGNGFDLPAITASPAGELFTVSGNRLCRMKFDASQSAPILSPFGQAQFKDPISIVATNDRIAVGDFGQHAVFVFDHQGKLLHVVGRNGPRKRGPWDPNTVERPMGLAIAADGCLWVAEDRFAPKRVARFSQNGKFMEEFLGPPMYGGGGHLDPDLKHFYYRSMQFALDWDKGTSRLEALNDRLSAEESPNQIASSFSYTPIGRPLYFKGKRYIVMGGTICQLEGDTWRACAVIGQAGNNHFLIGKESWKRHWAKFDLTRKMFIWCDKNDDGKYQVEEVEIFEMPGAGRPMSNLTVGPDLSMWGTHFKLKPYQLTAAGTPLFKSADIQPFDYDALAPHYPRNYTLSGPRSAKPHWFGFKWICEDGSLIQEGQPFIVNPDGKSILGGPVTSKPSDYIPHIDGAVLHTPFGFSGGAMTKSQIGEVAVVHSMNGYWFVWAPKYGVVVGKFFTGETGGWSYFEPKRGFDVSGRKHYWEGWFGDFIKALNGNYYAQGGKGYHSIARIDGLDDFKVSSVPLKFTAKDQALNVRLRPALKARHDAAQIARGKETARSMTAGPLAARIKKTEKFALDGRLAEWGDRRDMQVIGDAKSKTVFDVAQDDKGIYIALTAEARVDNAATDLKQLFRGGSCIDIQWRTHPTEKPRPGATTLPGPARGPEAERRIVIAKVKGKWTAVLYDYDASGVPDDKCIDYISDLGGVRCGRMTLLDRNDCRFEVVENSIEHMLEDTGGDLGAEPVFPGEAPKSKAPTPRGAQTWTAEIFIPWTTLSAVATRAMKFDVGIMQSDAAGKKIEKRSYWSNRVHTDLSDPAVEALLNPAAWGTLAFR